MQPKIFDIYLDIMNSDYQFIDFQGKDIVSGDTDSNIFNICLLKDYQPVNASGNTVVIVFEKPDKTTVFENLKIIDASTGKYTCTLSSQTIAVPGEIKAEVVLYEGTMKLTTTRFKFPVRKPILNENTVESSNEFSALTDALAEVEELKQTGLKGDKGDKGDPGDVSLAQLNDLAGVGRTTETVKGNADTLSGHETRIASVETNDVAISNRVSNNEAMSIRTADTPTKPTGHTKQITGYGILSMPNNAMGQVSVAMQGNTVNQLVQNGDLSNGTTGWAHYGNRSTESVVSGWLRSTFASIGIVFGSSSLWKVPTAQKIYVSFNARASKAGTVSWAGYKTGIALGIVSNVIHIPLTTSSQRFSAILTTTDIMNGIYFDCSVLFTGAGDYVEIQNIIAINLNAHGLDTSTQAQCDTRFPNYLKTGINSTLCAQRIQSKDSSDNVVSEAYVIVKDSEGKIVLLRSLPNGTKDKISVGADGNWYKTLRNNQIILNGGENWVDLNTASTNTYRMRIDNALLDALAKTKDSGIGYSTDGNYEFVDDSALDSRNVFILGEPRRLYLRIEKTKVDAMTGADITAKFKTYLNQYPITLNYQLSEPIVTPTDVIGKLIAYPNGTVVAEPSIHGFMTEAKKTVTTVEVPIKQVVKVIRYDISNTGMLIETDVTADVTIGDSNTSLTIANFVQGKMYFYDCDYPSELSTQAEVVLDVEVDNGIINHDYGASAVDWTLTTNEAKATMLICTNAGGAAKIIAPACDGKMYVIRNTSGQTITIKTASSTGVTVTTGKTATIIYSGTDFVKLSEV